MRRSHYHIEITDIKNLKKFLSGKIPFFQVSGENIFEIGFDCEPLEEFEKPDDHPSCCSFHSSVTKTMFEWYQSFPKNCSDYLTLTSKSWWKNDLYDHVPGKIIQNQLFCEHAIRKFIFSDTWYEDITEYFDYVIHSFGTPAIGLNQFFNCLKFYILNVSPKDWDFDRNKRDSLIVYLDRWIEGPSNNFDLQIYNQHIQKWLSILPEISSLNGIKHKLSTGGQISLMLKGKVHHNRYLNQSSIQTKSKGELISHLVELTYILLTQIESDLRNQNNIAENKRLELMHAQHLAEQRSLLTKFTKKEKKYVKVIKKWLLNEKKYFCEASELIEKISFKDSPHLFFLDQIKKFGKNFENQERLYSQFGEDSFRDYFISHLNSLREDFTVTGETFNKQGKTDILIKNEIGENILIGECKLWKGKKLFLDAIDQLLDRYMSWSTQNGVIIIFNTEHKTFSSIILNSKKYIEEHKKFKQIEKSDSQFFSAIFDHPEETDRKLNVEFIFFNYLKKTHKTSSKNP